MCVGTQRAVSVNQNSTAQRIMRGVGTMRTLSLIQNLYGKSNSNHARRGVILYCRQVSEADAGDACVNVTQPHQHPR